MSETEGVDPTQDQEPVPPVEPDPEIITVSLKASGTPQRSSGGEVVTGQSKDE
ncbi:hypothetical protein [Knoellia remsis]|uniref:hypothetical protein n=1 Tax=Knoellia remsis TaxID=407159 RepID=UPI0014744E97|nr:hypothetical protein [Knoellia remsis]